MRRGAVRQDSGEEGEKGRHINAMISSLMKKIMIVDGSDAERKSLVDILSDKYEIVEAKNGMEAMAYLHDRGLDISLMILAPIMPVMDGFEVLSMMNKNDWITTVPVVMISSEGGGALDRAYDLGAIDYIDCPFDGRTVKRRVDSNVMLSLRQKDLQELLAHQIYKREKENNLLIEILSNIVEIRNGESGLHIMHVHVITESILRALVKKTDKYGFTPEDIMLIGTASALHDIGKIAIPEAILNKPGKLTPEEREIMKTHTVEGANILDGMPLYKNEKLVRISRDICRWHHERYDGSGYPDGLKGDDIPIAAQAVSLADVYDALISKRVYKEAIAPEQAVSMIIHGECGAFNPLLLECLSEIAPSLWNELGDLANSVSENAGNSVADLIKYEGTDLSQKMMKELELERAKYNSLANMFDDITFEYTLQPEMIKLSDRSSSLLGLPAVIVNPSADERWLNVFPKKSFAEFTSAVRSSSRNTESVVRKYLLDIGDGEKWYNVVAKPLRSGDAASVLEGAICMIVDVNDSSLMLEQLERRAERDPLTGLFNVEAARRRIDRLLSAKKGKRYAMLFFDIDDFKKANDMHGHLFGDMVIKTLGEKIRSGIRSTDIAARIGGDEFIILLEYTDLDSIPIDSIFKRLMCKYEDFEITLSMGIATAEDNGCEFDVLINMADAAMYTVKYAGKSGYRFFDDSMMDKLKALGDKN